MDRVRPHLQYDPLSVNPGVQYVRQVGLSTEDHLEGAAPVALTAQGAPLDRDVHPGPEVPGESFVKLLPGAARTYHRMLLRPEGRAYLERNPFGEEPGISCSRTAVIVSEEF